MTGMVCYNMLWVAEVVAVLNEYGNLWNILPSEEQKAWQKLWNMMCEQLRNRLADFISFWKYDKSYIKCHQKNYQMQWLIAEFPSVMFDFEHSFKVFDIKYDHKAQLWPCCEKTIPDDVTVLRHDCIGAPSLPEPFIAKGPEK